MTLTVAFFFATGQALASTQQLHKSYPPHHLLWSCLSDNESTDWHEHGSVNDYGGGLQMHWNWGNGIVGDAGNYSRMDQEWAAETGYKNSGYSYSFLYSQWLEWDKAYYCLKYK